MPNSSARTYYVYILANAGRMLYVGVTNDLQRRIHQHRAKHVPGFTQKYNLTRLVYYAATPNVTAAISREKQIKGWLRAKKIALIEAQNPGWEDLAASWFETSAQAGPE